MLLALLKPLKADVAFEAPMIEYTTDCNPQLSFAINAMLPVAVQAPIVV
jgi:hypothetical protein